MRKIATLICVVLAVGLSGCVTPYGSAGLTGGYSEKQLEPDIWRVTFAGNGYTTSETVQTFWLYRCAQLSLEKGYDGFEIVSNIQLVSYRADRSKDAQLIQVHGGGGGGGGGAHGGGGSHGGGYYGFYYGPGIPMPVLTADIHMIKKPFASRPPKVFDAAALKSTLEPLVIGHLCTGNVCAHVHRYLWPDGQTPPQQAAPPQPSAPPAPAVTKST